ncbi:hypothetical protein AQJ27_45255 [Streptomyces olivochromogenes]|uniref:Nucleotide-diphosphate-sugar epimerase n=1 Tax=Streptomyces olivochromogenes TaxID=1963 RepID=A0A250VTG7_STROL|nr:hypothetical protein AQJ27_45255 [Streptomyces olivochromogenes]GAX57441.1 nucleotide-diphosphate-sugar epimerase [Streptomyces olivochromogenes]
MTALVSGERALRESRLSWTFPRPGTFSTNTLQWAHSIRDTGVAKALCPNDHASAIRHGDIVDIAVPAMTEPRHEAWRVSVQWSRVGDASVVPSR